MINFFQRHKTFRTIIYVSVVVTFVGAGFVGWGSVSLNNKNIIKSVGDEDITVKDLNREIYRLSYINFSNYKGVDKRQKVEEYISNNKEKISELALNNITKNLELLNYAKENLYLSISDSEISNDIMSDETFKKDDKFNIDFYKEQLKQFGYTPKEYEKLISNSLLNDKLESFLKKGLYPNKNEIKIFSDLLSMYKEMVVKITPLSSKFSDINVSEIEHKKKWALNKDKYMHKEFFNISFKKLTKDVNETADIFKNRALKETIKIKKGDEVLDESKNVSVDDELFQYLKQPVAGKVYKPIFLDGDALIVKINSIQKKTPMSFEEAKELSLIDIKKEIALELIVKEMATLDINNGSNYIGKVSSVSSVPVELIKKVEDEKLSSAIYKQLISKVQTKGSFLLDDNVISYEIIGTGILNNDEKLIPVDKMISQFLYNIKKEEYLSSKISL